MSGRKYAVGRNAVAECQRSGQKMRYRDLVEDGHVPGLLVHPQWWEPKHPQEVPVTVTDPIALYKPAPEISIPDGYGDAENLQGGTTPTAPSGSNSITVTAATVIAGATQVVLDEAQAYEIGQWVFIELDGGGYFVSRITVSSDCASLVVPFTSPFVGVAAIGNDVSIGDGVEAAATQTFTITVANYSGMRNGYTVIGGDAGLVSPTPALLTVEDGDITEFLEITFYGSGVGLELWFGSGIPGTDPNASLLFSTFSSLEIDHVGGTLVLDPLPINLGGDMDTDSGAYEGINAYWYFAGAQAPKIWTDADEGLQYDVRFIV
jgi:hypothetical protein